MVCFLLDCHIYFCLLKFYSSRCGLIFGLDVEFVEPEKAEANKPLQAFSDRMRKQDVHLVLEPPHTVDGQSEVHSSSSSMQHGTSDQSSSSTKSQRHEKRRCEKDCLFEQDVSRFKRVRLISRQERVKKPMVRPDRFSNVLRLLRPRWNVYLLLTKEQIAHDLLQETECVFGLYHQKTVDAMVSLAEMFNARQRFEVSQQLLERAINVQSQLKLVDPSEALRPLNSLALIYMDQNKLEEAEEICRLMATKAKTELGKKKRDSYVYQEKLIYVLHLSGKVNFRSLNQRDEFNSMMDVEIATQQDLQECERMMFGISISCYGPLSLANRYFLPEFDGVMEGFWETGSVCSEFFDYPFENGRRYHAVSPKENHHCIGDLQLGHKVS
jgi:hypothetical protein